MKEKKSTLYELTGRWLDLYDMADDPDMEADVQAWFDTMECLEGEIEDKADGYAKVIAQLNADADAIKKEEERLYKRRSAIENRVKNMKSRLQNMMEMTGKTKFRTGLYSFNVQNNAPSVVIDNPDLVPKAFWIQKDPEISNTLVKEYLNSLPENKECAFAHMYQSRSLRIR